MNWARVEMDGQRAILSGMAPSELDRDDAMEAARRAGPDVRFVGLDVKDSTSRAIAMQDKYGVDYPSIVDEKGTWFAQLPWLPRALPGTVIIDPSGHVRATVIGPVCAGTVADASPRCHPPGLRARSARRWPLRARQTS